MKTEINTNDVVKLENDTVAIVTGYAKGWFSGKTEDGSEIKFRGNKVADVLGKAEQHTGPRNMSKILQRYRPTYEPTVAYSGRKSLNNGDEIADLLSGMDPRSVVAAAERVLALEPGELWNRYEGLNPGQIRMNGGNRIRSAIKRGDVTIKEVQKLVH